MSDPKTPPKLTEEQIAAAQEALEKAIADTMTDPTATEELLEQTVPPVGVGQVLERLNGFDLGDLVGPILGNVAALQAELVAIRERLVPPQGADALRLVHTLDERANRLEGEATSLGGTELLGALAEALEDVQNVLDATGERSPAVALTRAALLSRLGQRKPANAAFARALALAEIAGALDAVGTATTALQLDAIQRGDLETAIGLARRVTAVADRVGDRKKSVQSRYDEGLLLARSGKGVEGSAIVEHALDEAKALGSGPELVARGVVVLAKIQEGDGADEAAWALYESLLAHEATPGLEAEVAQGAMGILRLVPTEALTLPIRFRALAIVRAHALAHGNTESYAQSSLLLAESEEARGDKLAALVAIIEGRDALASAGSNPAPLERALAQVRQEWGPDVFDALMRQLLGGAEA